jgi:hypothetical protein
MTYIFIAFRDCNLADGEYVVVPEQGAAQEVASDPAQEPASEDLPATALEGKPRFLCITCYLCSFTILNDCRIECALRCRSCLKP